ncbi:ABC transporter ATP-binding protein [Actinophytocola sp. KF-1]
MSLLSVRDLRVSFPTADGLVLAVRGVSFDVEPGRTLGVVGESGSGKTVCTQTLIGLVPGAEVRGQAFFDGEDLLAMPPARLRAIRGARIATVFQDPLSSLHPLYRVGWQITELIRAHRPVTRRAARARAIELLALVGIPHAARRVDDYPHEFSGGMRQRVMIAMALALEPELIIADEPTTALDATVQAQILDLLARLREQLGTALILITHDLGVVADIADEVLVMYAGRVAEAADRRATYYAPHHPYTKGLLESIPGAAGVSGVLRPIPGLPPSMIAVPGGCAFHPRCRYAMPRCRTDQPDLRPVGPGHRSACWLPVRLTGFGDQIEAERERAAAAEAKT